MPAILYGFNNTAGYLYRLTRLHRNFRFNGMENLFQIQNQNKSIVHLSNSFNKVLMSRCCSKRNTVTVTKLELVHSDSVSFGATPAHEDFVKAVGKMDNTFVLILDLEKIFHAIEEEVSV